jgi:hypothetical protein
MKFTAGQLVFYDDSDGGALEVRPLPDQRAVMADIPEGATRVVVVAPVVARAPAWSRFRVRTRLSARRSARRIPSR